MSVVLPEPFSPTSARLVPGVRCSVTCSRAGSSASGYVKLTSSKRTPSAGCGPRSAVPKGSGTSVSRYS